MVVRKGQPNGGGKGLFGGGDEFLWGRFAILGRIFR